MLSNNASTCPVLSVCLRQDLSKLHKSPVSAFGVAGIYYRQQATMPRKKTLLNSVAAATVTILLLDKNIYGQILKSEIIDGELNRDAKEAHK